MSTETILWLNSDHVLNEQARERWVTVDGRRVKEKFPQTGHVGADWSSRQVAPGVRYTKVINQHGNLVNWVLTNGAAHMDHTTGWGQHQLAKARHFGCFGLDQCPCALVRSGHLMPGQMVNPSVRDAQPCAPGTYSSEKPCPHAIAERDARLAETRRINEEREARHKQHDAKVLEVQQEQMKLQREQMDIQRKQTEALIAAVGLKLDEKGVKK